VNKTDLIKWLYSSRAILGRIKLRGSRSLHEGGDLSETLRSLIFNNNIIKLIKFIETVRSYCLIKYIRPSGPNQRKGRSNSYKNQIYKIN